jgi:hypothetical protein
MASPGESLERGGSVSSGDDGSVPEATVFQPSCDHYGVFHRQEPQLRVVVLVETGAYKIEQYLVRLSECMPARNWFAGLASYHGNTTSDQGREAFSYHLLQAIGEFMKALFWARDLDGMRFLPEITVQPLIQGSMCHLTLMTW